MGAYVIGWGSEQGARGVALDAGRSDGFAAVDALVALLVLATALALSLRAADTARRSAAQADETRLAQVLLRDLLDARADAPGVREGRSSGFAWRTELAPRPTALAEVRTCTRRVELTGLRSGRHYRAETSEFCFTGTQRR